MNLPRLVAALALATLSTAALAATYYVKPAPAGSDTNPGTLSQPWASMYKASKTAVAGDTVIFEDGTYAETKKTIPTNGGTASAPIIYRARNQYQAKIVYQSDSNSSNTVGYALYNTDHLNINPGTEYITFRDFEITQLAKGTNTDDILVRVEANHCSIIGNKIHGCYEDGLKISGGATYVYPGPVNDYAGIGYFLFEGNTIYDVEHEGIDVVRGYAGTIRFNDIYDIGRIGVMCKGGIRSVVIHGNNVHAPKAGALRGITLGGSTDAQYAYNPYGYESYSCFGWGNIVQGNWGGGIEIRGGKNTAFYNNTIIGANYGLMVERGGKTAADGPVGVKMWYWTNTAPLPQDASPSGYTIEGEPRNTAITFKNNVIVQGGNSAAYATKFETGSLLNDDLTELSLDYNLYYGFGSNITAPGSINKGTEAHGTYSSDPQFTTNYSNLYPKSTSPMINTALSLSGGRTGFYGENINVSADFDNISMNNSGTWERGAYNYGSPTIVYVSDDTFVRDGTYQNTTNGSSTVLDAKAGDTDYHRIVLLKFNLTGYTGTVDGAKLNLYVTSKENSTNPVGVKVFAVATDTWTEGTATWANKPTIGAELAYTAVSTTGQYISFDLRDYVTTEFAGNKIVSIAIDTSDNYRVSFNSDEAASNRPFLEFYKH